MTKVSANVNMPSNIRYLKYWFLGLLLLGCTSVAGFDLLYGIPQRKCESTGSWWRWQDRVCYKPIYLPTLTHRPAGQGNALNWHDHKAAQDLPGKGSDSSATASK